MPARACFLKKCQVGRDTLDPVEGGEGAGLVNLVILMILVNLLILVNLVILVNLANLRFWARNTSAL